jgi:hypothetical protein
MDWATFWAIFYKLIWPPCLHVRIQAVLIFIQNEGQKSSNGARHIDQPRLEHCPRPLLRPRFHHDTNVLLVAAFFCLIAFRKSYYIPEGHS